MFDVVTTNDGSSGWFPIRSPLTSFSHYQQHPAAAVRRSTTECSAHWFRRFGEVHKTVSCCRLLLLYLSVARTLQLFQTSAMSESASLKVAGELKHSEAACWNQPVTKGTKSRILKSARV